VLDLRRLNIAGGKHLGIYCVEPPGGRCGGVITGRDLIAIPKISKSSPACTSFHSELSRLSFGK